MRKYKNIIIFLSKFFLTYFILVQMYALYLQNSQSKEDGFKVASITALVAKQTTQVLSLFNYNVEAIQHTEELSVKLIIEQVYLARVIEGCNSISVIILFIAFIVAFSGSIKATILFSLFGGGVIYTINVLRISLLTAMMYKYPEKQALLHDLVFPAIIYGTVLLLWIIWVNKFSKFKNE